MSKMSNLTINDDGVVMNKYGYFDVEYGEGEGEMLIRAGTPKSSNPVFNAGLEKELQQEDDML